MFDSSLVGHPARRDASRGGPSVLNCSHTRSGVVDHLGIGTEGASTVSGMDDASQEGADCPSFG